jgi:probable HAF family extracellular repeat protein
MTAETGWRPLTWVCALVALAVLNLPARADVVVTEVKGLPFGASTRVYGLNLSGRVVGEADTAFGMSHAIFANPPGDAIDLGTLPMGFSSRASAINASGMIVGRSQAFEPGSGFVTQAFLSRDGGAPVSLGSLPGSRFSEANAINVHGVVAGTAQTAAGLSRAVRWVGTGKPTDLFSVVTKLGKFNPAGASEAFGINAKGWIVGRAETLAGITRAFLFKPKGQNGGTVADLGGLFDGGASEARAINGKGQVTGAASALFGGSHAFYYDAHVGLVDIHTPGRAGSSIGLGLNGMGQVVGRLDLPGLGSRAFLWSSGTGMLDLNGLIDRSLGWTLTEATGINNAGQIIGNGTFRGRTRGFVISVRADEYRISAAGAVPEPSSLWLLAGAGATGAAVWIARRRGRAR